MSELLSLWGSDNHMSLFSIVGRKSGKGVYLYEEGKKDRPENPGALQILKQLKQEPRLPYVYIYIYIYIYIYY